MEGYYEIYVSLQLVGQGRMVPTGVKAYRRKNCFVSEQVELGGFCIRFFTLSMWNGAGFSPFRENQVLKKILKITKGWRRFANWMRHSDRKWKSLYNPGM